MIGGWLPRRQQSYKTYICLGKIHFMMQYSTNPRHQIVITTLPPGGEGGEEAVQEGDLADRRRVNLTICLQGIPFVQLGFATN